MENEFTVRSMRYDYGVVFEQDFRTEIREILESEKCVFLIDRNIWDKYGLAELIPQESFLVTLIEAVESNKTIYGVIDVWNKWEKAGITKKHKVVVIGGGILQDIGAFASSIYLRNIDWYFFPTTLLAQCDSCIGSKCGINLHEFKNQLGAFYAPKRIVIDTHFLNSLSDQDLYSGMGEILKASLTSDVGFYHRFRDIVLSGRDKAELENLIRDSLMVKKEVVEADEFEKDYRRVLNYGHTFGHALEAYTKNEIPHGAAVTLGVDMANFIAWKKGFISEEEYRDVKLVASKLFRFKFPENVDMDRLFIFMRKDKKSEGEKVNFVIPKRLGELQILPMSLDQGLKVMLTEYFQESHEIYRN